METASQIAPEIVASFERMREKTRAFEAEWTAWTVEAQVPGFERCEAHDAKLDLERARSIAASFSGDKHVALYARCPDCLKAEELRRRSDFLRECGVSDENILHASFDNFITRTAADGEILAAARAFAEAGRGFLLMRGDYGTGKSHLAVAIIRATGLKSKFITQVRLLAKLRETYRDNKAENVVETCKRVKLLVLDEVGLSSGGKDELPMLHDILSARHETRKPTILTTNLVTDDELKEAIGERMFDRLTQSGVAKLRFSGESLRRKFRDLYHK